MSLQWFQGKRRIKYVLCLVSQWCLTLCDPTDCNPPGSSVHGDSPGKNIGIGCHALLQGNLPNPGILQCRWILYWLSHWGSPRILEVGSLSLLQGIFPTQEWNQGLLHCRWILYQLSYQGAPNTSAVIWKNQGTRKEVVTNVSALGISNPLTNLSNIFLIFSCGFQENTGALSSPSF